MHRAGPSLATDHWQELVDGSGKKMESLDAEAKRQAGTLESIIAELEQRIGGAVKVLHPLWSLAADARQDLAQARRDREQLAHDKTELLMRLKVYEDKEGSLKQTVSDVMGKAGTLLAVFTCS